MLFAHTLYNIFCSAWLRQHRHWLRGLPVQQWGCRGITVRPRHRPVSLQARSGRRRLWEMFAGILWLQWLRMSRYVKEGPFTLKRSPYLTIASINMIYSFDLKWKCGFKHFVSFREHIYVLNVHVVLIPLLYLFFFCSMLVLCPWLHRRRMRRPLGPLHVQAPRHWTHVRPMWGTCSLSYLQSFRCEHLQIDIHLWFWYHSPLKYLAFTHWLAYF